MNTNNVRPDSYWERWHYEGWDGYDIMEKARAFGCHAISSWGRDGWDLGSWPYVIVYSHKNPDDSYEIVIYVEGDIDQWHCATKADRTAFFYWKGEEWAKGIEKFEDAPTWLRGPYSTNRPDATM